MKKVLFSSGVEIKITNRDAIKLAESLVQFKQKGIVEFQYSRWLDKNNLPKNITFFDLTTILAIY